MEIHYHLADFEKYFEEFYEYYYFTGQHTKEDFVVPNWFITFDDPEQLHDYDKHRSPLIHIKYKDMRSILSMRFPPISRKALKKLMKGVYNRSRTRGFFKPSEVDRYANLLVDFYVKKKSANMIGLV